MEFDKGRGKTEKEEVPDTVEGRMMKLAELKLELRGYKAEYEKKTKHLRDTIRSYENIIIAEVMNRKESVTVGNIRAEYIPSVKFQFIREDKNGE